MSASTRRKGSVRSNRLQRGLSLLFFAVLILVSVVQSSYIFTRVYHDAENAAELSGAFLAETLARALEPFCQTQVDPAELRRIGKEIRNGIPGVRAYLIDAEGKELANLGMDQHPKGRIDIEPVEAFLTLPRAPGAVFYDNDPADPLDTKSKTTFAAARIAVLGKPAYLYLTLDHTFLLQTLRFRFDETLLRFILVTVAVQVVLVVLIAMFLYRVLTTRLRALVGVLNRYRSGEHSARADVAGSDEVAELARATNEMAETIEQKIDELAERDLKRRELIANVTHDLRAPASVIKGFAGILGERAVGEDDLQGREMYTAIMHSSDALSKLLGQLWELSKLEAREQPVVPERVPPGELIDEIAQSFQASAQAKGVSLVVNVDDQLQAVSADPALITRAIRNLIDNALTYTLPGGTVEVCGVPTEPGLRVEVRDTGVGISAADLPQIFERSFRVKKWEGQRQDSGGLGLAIVRHIIEAHGQSITVQSWENEGTVFSFLLPWAA